MMIQENKVLENIFESKKGGYLHITFHSEFSSLCEKESEIAMRLIDLDYEITDKTIFYVGGGIIEGIETYVNLDTHEYSIEPYEYVDYGVWKLKFKLKNKKLDIFQN